MVDDKLVDDTELSAGVAADAGRVDGGEELE
jgi:hypothetical protein